MRLSRASAELTGRGTNRSQDFTGQTDTEATTMARDMVRLLRDEEGVATVEYALLLSLVVVAGMAAWQGLSQTIGNVLRESTVTIATGGNN